MLDWHRSLIGLRRSTPELLGLLDRVAVACDDDAGWLWFSRGPIVVAFSIAPAEVLLPVAATDRAEVLLASHEGVAVDADGAVRLPPDSVAMLRRM